ncbi:MazG nucleotide pyrophosphohydrolase domain-containing protein [Rothia sp. CCM 9417]|uniref:MazG nucleotide pyrophosphohydrolase domain-containing protein n=1 Tax=Rothia sp. CCM 9417 TaxID=3402657 RepID=UPI003ADE32F0
MSQEPKPSEPQPSTPKPHEATNRQGTGQQIPGSDRTPTAADFSQLLEIMQTLRQPGGCAWTGAQTHQSIMHYLIEETYEVLEALEDPRGLNLPLLREELGDVLLNLIFHAQMASEVPAELGGFGMEDVVADLAAKLIRRNPHVFSPREGDGPGPSAQEICEAWDRLKKLEKPERRGLLDGIPPHLPALALADKTLDKASKAGLWPCQGENPAGLPAGIETEEALGAYLFELVAAARAAGLDAERSLRSHTRSYIQHHSE